jgi:hypothetical protein
MYAIFFVACVILTNNNAVCQAHDAVSTCLGDSANYELRYKTISYL